jgi:hypothetical protein
MAEGADSAAAWENPLIPNARLRQIHVAMMQARTLARAVPARRGDRGTLGLEACLVSPAVDLGAGDLVSDAIGGGVVEYLRGAMLVEVLGSGRISRRHGVTSSCGEAARLADAPGVAERIWMALGAAAGLKAQAARVKKDVKTDAAARQMGVVVAYTLAGEMQPALWRKALTFAREKALPVLFVVLPGRPAGAVKIGRVSALSLNCSVPGMAVDADDAVALYRVAQESLGHARIGGGPAVMECVPYVLAVGRRAPPVDAIEGLEQYILQRKVATRAWMEREAKSFAKQAASVLAASK